MKKLELAYACSRCISRSGRPGKCANCGFLREPVCRMCGNASSNCYFVDCPGYLKIKKGSRKKAPRARRN